MSTFTSIVSRISHAACLLCVCSTGLAANITFSGQVAAILEDLGTGIYADTEVGESFSGAINDATLEGFITDNETLVPVHCCVGGANALSIKDNEVLGAQEAELLNSLIGTSFVAGDMVDLVVIEAGSETVGGGLFIMELDLVFDASKFNNQSLANYPPDLSDLLVSLVFGKELNSQLETIFEALGVVEIQVNDDDFQINAGLNDAWVNDGAPLQGLFLTVFPNLQALFLSWFTFDIAIPPGDDAVFGAGDQRWVTGLGIIEGGSVMINVELTSGGVFNGSDPQATQIPGYGIIRIGFISCSEAVLLFDFPGAGLSGSMRLQRVLPDNVSLCEALAAQ